MIGVPPFSSAAEALFPELRQHWAHLAGAREDKPANTLDHLNLTSRPPVSFRRAQPITHATAVAEIVFAESANEPC